MNELDFCKNLKKLRNERGYTLKDMAGKLGLSMSAYRNYEAGRQEPRLETIYKLTKILHTDFNGLLGGYVSNKEVSRVLEEVIKDLRELGENDQG